MTEPARANGNGLTLTGWGATLRASGRDVVLWLMLGAGFVGLGYILERGFDRSGAGQALDRRDRLAEHRAIVTAQNDLACMLAVPVEPRNLRLEAAMDPQGACHYISTVYRFEGSRR